MLMLLMLMLLSLSNATWHPERQSLKASKPRSKNGENALRGPRQVFQQVTRNLLSLSLSLSLTHNPGASFQMLQIRVECGQKVFDFDDDLDL